MTAAAKIRRAFRHKHEQGVTQHLRSNSLMRFGATEGQLRAAVRTILMRHTSLMRQRGIIAAP